MRQFLHAAFGHWVIFGAVAAWSQPAADTASVRPSGSLELVGLTRDERALNRAHDVELEGNLAFVPGKGGSLAIISVADPSAPKLLGSPIDPVEYEDAETVLLAGDVLMLGTRDFFASDVSDPTRPVSVAQYRGGLLFPTRRYEKLPGPPKFDNAHDLVYRDGHIYVTARNDHSLDILRINDPRIRRLAEQ